MQARLHTLDEPANGIDGSPLRQRLQALEGGGRVPQDGLARVVEHAETIHTRSCVGYLPGGQTAVVEDAGEPVMLGTLCLFERC